MGTGIKIEIRRSGHDTQRYGLPLGVYTIGRDADCQIHLDEKQVELRHAIFSVRSDECWIEDLSTEHGTLLNGNVIVGRETVLPGQMIAIGSFSLLIESSEETEIGKQIFEGGSACGEKTESEKQEGEDGKTESGKALREPSKSPSQSREIKSDPSPVDNTAIEQKRSIKQQIHRELVERLDIKRLTAGRIKQEELHKKAKATIEKIVNDVKDRLPHGTNRKALVKEVYDEALRLGPLEDFLEDETVSEIMVNGHGQVYVERNGRLELTEMTFMDDSSVLAIIERIVSPLGRRIDESQPFVDARLPDGSRVNAIIHPLSLVGPCLTIRKFSKTPFTDKDLARFGTLTSEAADFLRICVRLRKNIIVSGGTGSGKTTLLNVLSEYLPDVDRIVTIEDAAELRLSKKHVVRLEARPPNIEGRGAVTIRDLVRNALRMRPDRIVVGECRGGEALDMLQAMNTGHDGSLTTVHANSPRDVISRLETMVLMSGMDLPIRAIREQVASAIDMIVHESRLSDGSRKVTKVTEVMGLEGDQITMQDIFEYNQTGIDEDGKVEGLFMPTGSVPSFLDDIKSRGMSIDHSIFDPNHKKKL